MVSTRRGLLAGVVVAPALAAAAAKLPDLPIGNVKEMTMRVVHDEWNGQVTVYRRWGELVGTFKRDIWMRMSPAARARMLIPFVAYDKDTPVRLVAGVPVFTLPVYRTATDDFRNADYTMKFVETWGTPTEEDRTEAAVRTRVMDALTKCMRCGGGHMETTRFGIAARVVCLDCKAADYASVRVVYAPEPAW